MKRWFIAGAVLVAVALLVLLCFFDPQQTWWFPRCPFKVLTGLECPGCGSQRAGYQILHGNIGQALYYNAFLIISLPYMASLVITSIAPKTKLVKLRRLTYHPIVVWCFVALLILWWILRNILFNI